MNIDRKSYAHSRIVWKWVTGKEPERLIDHINRDRTDDRFWNLREVDEAGNMLNRPRYGKAAVTQQYNRWRVQRMVNGQRLDATFNTEREARLYAEFLDTRMNAERMALFSEGT